MCHVVSEQPAGQFYHGSTDPDLNNQRPPSETRFKLGAKRVTISTVIRKLISTSQETLLSIFGVKFPQTHTKTITSTTGVTVEVKTLSRQVAVTIWVHVSILFEVHWFHFIMYCKQIGYIWQWILSVIQCKHIKQIISPVTPCSPSFKTCANWKKRTGIRWRIWRIVSALLFILWHVGLQDTFVDLVYGLLCMIQHEFDLCKLELHRSCTVCTHNEVEINDTARIWLVTSPAPSYNRLIKL